jgi:DnaJ-domain-containing protein 1
VSCALFWGSSKIEPQCVLCSDLQRSKSIGDGLDTFRRQRPRSVLFIAMVQGNEVQKQQRVNSVEAAEIALSERQLSGIQAALLNLQRKDELVAQR